MRPHFAHVVVLREGREPSLHFLQEYFGVDLENHSRISTIIGNNIQTYPGTFFMGHTSFINCKTAVLFLYLPGGKYKRSGVFGIIIRMDNKFVWTQDFSVQNHMIDEQHQTFFAIANELEDLASNGAAGKGVLLEGVAKLGNYAFYHFGTEEEMFSKYGYPEAVEHIAAHNAFRKEATDLINKVRVEVGDIRDLSRETADFAGNWLKNHILVVDKKYAQFFLGKGLV